MKNTIIGREKNRGVNMWVNQIGDIPVELRESWPLSGQIAFFWEDNLQILGVTRDAEVEISFELVFNEEEHQEELEVEVDQREHPLVHMTQFETEEQNNFWDRMAFDFTRCFYPGSERDVLKKNSSKWWDGSVLSIELREEAPKNLDYSRYANVLDEIWRHRKKGVRLNLQVQEADEMELFTVLCRLHYSVGVHLFNTKYSLFDVFINSEVMGTKKLVVEPYSTSSQQMSNDSIIKYWHYKNKINADMGEEDDDEWEAYYGKIQAIASSLLYTEEPDFLLMDRLFRETQQEFRQRLQQKECNKNKRWWKERAALCVLAAFEKSPLEMFQSCFDAAAESPYNEQEINKFIETLNTTKCWKRFLKRAVKRERKKRFAERKNDHERSIEFFV